MGGPSVRWNMIRFGHTHTTARSYSVRQPRATDRPSLAPCGTSLDQATISRHADHAARLHTRMSSRRRGRVRAPARRLFHHLHRGGCGTAQPSAHPTDVRSVLGQQRRRGQIRLGDVFLLPDRSLRHALRLDRGAPPLGRVGRGHGAHPRRPIARGDVGA